MGSISQTTRLGWDVSTRESDVPKDLWKDVRALNIRVSELTKIISVQSQIISAIRRGQSSLSGLHPFKIYRLPSQYRDGGPTPDGLDWRRIRVRTGRVFVNDLQLVAGTDAVTQPEIETFLDNPMAADILVPEMDDSFYIWVRFDDSGAQLYYGDDPGSTADPDFDSFPNNDSKHIIIGIVDSQSLAASQQLNITQLVRADIYGTGAGGGGLITANISIANAFQIGGSNIFADYFTCLDSIGNPFPVAKPWNILGSTASADVGAITYVYDDPTCLTRVATGDPAASPHNEIVTPDYQEGQPILISPISNVDLDDLQTDPTDANYNNGGADIIPVVNIQVGPSIFWALTS